MAIELNPWKRPLLVSGWDESGNKREIVLPRPMPSFYFWLGEAAYPEWPVIQRVEAARCSLRRASVLSRDQERI